VIPDETVERVRTAADIVQIIGEHVPLRRVGADFRGPCPFHQGTKPNFSVSPKRGTYHCFVCHEGGDVFTFLRKRLGLDWPAAVKLVGERVGIEVVDAPLRARAPDPNEGAWELLATAAEWFAAQLRDETAGREARAYLGRRDLDAADWARFGLGFAPWDGQALRRHLRSLGFDDERQRDAGVLARHDGEAEPRARFRGRVTFPILDEFGHHVGFGGRALGDEVPKYLNSPESAVFQKRRTLYGLHAARPAVRRAGRALVVEGYLDVIRVALCGVEEVVAPLGTALTEEQAALLARYVREVFLLYDSDEAGQKATFRSGLELLRHGVAVRVVTLPAGEDPDSFVRRAGREGLEALLGQAIDLFDRQVQLLERHGWFADLRRRRRAIDKLLPTVRAARDAVTRDLYLARLAEVSKLDRATLQAELEAVPDASPGIRAAPGSAPTVGEGPPDASPPAAEAPSPPAPASARPWTGRRRGRPGAPEWASTAAMPRPRASDPVERAVVRAMLVDRALVERVAERHGPDDFRDPDLRAIYAALLAVPADASVDAVAESLEGGALRLLRELAEDAVGESPDTADVTLGLARLDARRLEARIDELREAMAQAPRERQDALLRELVELESDVRRLLPIRMPRGKPRAS
jgi:DNA primase